MTGPGRPSMVSITTVDVLVNNAGIRHVAPITEFEPVRGGRPGWW